MLPTLNEKQAELLRYLYRQTGPVPTAHLDGRIVRALKSRKYIDERGGWVTVSDAGREAYEKKDHVKTRQRRRRSSVANGAGHARAHAVHRAIEALEVALPKDAEVVVGRMFAYADDVVEALRRHARKLEKRHV
jgi:hypothetical protein